MKHIIFCADGTWNSPDADDNNDGTPDPTNVYKLFVRLDGTFDLESINKEKEQELALKDAAGNTLQVAKYLCGVGSGDNPINKVVGGAFGAGIIKRIVRGYTFISREYRPGDKIHLVGFSRGAYTARALGGLLLSQGVLRPALTRDKESAYALGCSAWYRYRAQATKRTNTFGKLIAALSDLPSWLSQAHLDGDDLIPVDSIETIAVWDTVGSLGIPVFASPDERTDVFRFADNVLSPKVKRGLHALARDELRVDFTPTLWAPAANVTQMIFPGAHGDVGGGYPMTNNESGLSDIALEWILTGLAAQGLRFTTLRGFDCNPTACAPAHKPWLKPPFTAMLQAPRHFPADIPEHSAVAERKNCPSV